MPQLLLISTTLARSLAVYIFWCAGMGETALTLDASNAGIWIFGAWVIAAGCSAMGRPAVRGAAGVFLVGDTAVGALYLLISFMGGIPAGFIGIPVAREASLLAAIMLFATAALQLVILRQGDGRGGRFNACFLLSGATLAVTLGISAALFVYAETGRRAGDASLSDHAARAGQLTAEGRGAQGLSEARRALVTLAIEPGFADPERSRRQCLCGAPYSIAARVTSQLSDGPRGSGFGYLWLGGYQRALENGLSDEAVLTLFLANADMGRTAQRGYQKLAGFYAASRYHFDQAPQNLSNQDFWALTITLASWGVVAPNPEAQADLAYGVERVTARMSKACADPSVRDYNAPGCDLFEQLQSG